MRALLLLAVVVIGLALPAEASAMKLVSITSPVSRGSYVQLIVRTSVARSVCGIKVHHGSGPALVADGLGNKGALFAGILQWRWKMPAKATRGTWSADLSCGAAGSLHTTFVVR